MGDKPEDESYDANLITKISQGLENVFFSKTLAEYSKLYTGIYKHKFNRSLFQNVWMMSATTE